MILAFRDAADRDRLAAWLAAARGAGERIVFTNGCFDFIHYGHGVYLAAARAHGDRLVVGVNADASVRANKGPGRPLAGERERAATLAELRSVDLCVIFDELTPKAIVEFIRPDILAKGDEYREDQIIGAAFVRSYGGAVARIPMAEGFSTTSLLARSSDPASAAPAPEPVAPRVVGVIPARYGSTRLPGKPLADLAGKPLIWHVVEACRRARSLDTVIVATDDDRIVRAVEAFGGRAVLTSPGCRSGTDRVMEVAISEPGDVFVNIQGDEPLMPPELVDRLVGFLLANPAFDIVTAAAPTAAEADFRNPNAVKAVVAADGRALYFSRAPIPHDRDGAFAGCLKHLGIYLYRRKALMDFARRPQGLLEVRESLEQLRALESGMTIGVLPVDYHPVGVDTPEDLERVRRLLAGAGND